MGREIGHDGFGSVDIRIFLILYQVNFVEVAEWSCTSCLTFRSV